MSHYVYRLLDQHGDVIYIGRSLTPERRRWLFQHRRGIPVRLGQMERYSDFDQACAAELRAIARMRPRFNKILASSPGNLGMKNSAEKNAKVSAKLKGRVGTMLGRSHSEETRAKMSASLIGRAGTMTGRTFTPEHRAKISAANKGNAGCGWAKGKPRSPEHSAAIRKALLAKKEHA